MIENLSLLSQAVGCGCIIFIISCKEHKEKIRFESVETEMPGCYTDLIKINHFEFTI